MQVERTGASKLQNGVKDHKDMNLFNLTLNQELLEIMDLHTRTTRNVALGDVWDTLVCAFQKDSAKPFK